MPGKFKSYKNKRNKYANCDKLCLIVISRGDPIDNCSSESDYSYKKCSRYSSSSSYSSSSEKKYCKKNSRKNCKKNSRKNKHKKCDSSSYSSSSRYSSSSDCDSSSNCESNSSGWICCSFPNQNGDEGLKCADGGVGVTGGAISPIVLESKDQLVQQV